MAIFICFFYFSFSFSVFFEIIRSKMYNRRFSYYTYEVKVSIKTVLAQKKKTIEIIHIHIPTHIHRHIYIYISRTDFHSFIISPIIKANKNYPKTASLVGAPCITHIVWKKKMENSFINFSDLIFRGFFCFFN